MACFSTEARDFSLLHHAQMI